MSWRAGWSIKAVSSRLRISSPVRLVASAQNYYRVDAGLAHELAVNFAFIRARDPKFVAALHYYVAPAHVYRAVELPLRVSLNKHSGSCQKFNPNLPIRKLRLSSPGRTRPMPVPSGQRNKVVATTATARTRFWATLLSAGMRLFPLAELSRGRPLLGRTAFKRSRARAGCRTLPVDVGHFALNAS